MYLCTEGEVHVNLVQIVLQQEHHPLVEGVVLRLHVRVVDGLPEDVLVEGAREEAVQELVVVDGLGDNPAHKLEVVEMIRVDMRARIRHVGHAIAGRGLEEGVVGVEHLPGDYEVPLPQESAGVLAFFALERDVQVRLHLLRVAPVQFAEGILEDVVATEMNDQVLPPQALVQLLQLLPKVASLDVKVQQSCVVDQHGKRSLGEWDGALTQDLVEDGPMAF